MRQSRPMFRLWFFVVLGIVASSLAVRWLQWSMQQRDDLGNKPASQVFHQVFLCPLPVGVSNLKIAGESSLSGEVWMRFQVRDVDAFLAAMKSNPLMPLTVEADGLSYYLVPSQSDTHRDHYSRDVGWGAVYQVRHPETYSYQSAPPGRGWFGPIVVDRSQRTVYIHGGLM